MDFSPSVHQRFIHRVHRRLLLVRVAESLALTFAVGCLLAIVPVLILQWRGESIFPLLMALLFLCPLAAVAVLLRNWPTHLVAAAQADRQLRLGELLSTAIQIRLGRAAPAADVLCDAVLAMADERCRTLGPSDVLLRRWGARAWGGLGLSVALLLAAAMIPLRPLRSDANDSVLSNSQPSISAALPSDLAVAPAAVHNSASDDASQLISFPQPPGRPAVASPPSPSQSAPGHEMSSTAAGSSNSIGRAARSGSDSRAASIAETSSRRSNLSKPIALPAWNSRAWPRDSSGNSTAADENVPPSCRDLVHDYFERFEN